MHVIVIFLILASFMIVTPADHANAWVDLGISIGDEGIRGFYLAAGDYYSVPQKEVVVIRERGLPVEEVPVVLLIAKRAHVAPTAVIDLRLSGSTWINIMFHFGLSPEILYVPVKGVYGPPYGKAYGHYKNKPKKKWKTIVLGDDDVINLVNLKFISDYHGFAPEEVIKMRSQGKGFVGINDEVRKCKGGKNLKINKDKEKSKELGKGKKYKT